MFYVAREIKMKMDSFLFVFDKKIRVAEKYARILP